VRKIVFITPSDARYGFGLAGVRQLVPEHDGLYPLLSESMEDPAIGVIAIDERILGGSIRESIFELERDWDGVIVVLPAPEAAARPSEDYAMRIIREAIGYQVRINP
jgi:V/A-type H+-transporting ATPase subunit F